MKNLLRKIENESSCKIIFTDFFDTLVHRTVHPNYVVKLWAKIMIGELGIQLTVDKLFSIRFDALSYLSQHSKLKRIEVPYTTVIKEIYNRLINTQALHNLSFDEFEKTCKQADYVSEISVQFKNDRIVDSLIELKNKGYRIFLITDFFLPKEIISKIIAHHELTSIFDDIFVSCDLKQSKEEGSLFNYVLEATGAKASETIMIGDNKNSDIINSGKHGIKSIHTKNSKHHFRNKRNLIGSDQKTFKKACSQVEERCAESEFAYSEYIINFYFFIERLYKKARRDKVTDLFFLAREGLYLKKLFDTYQELNQLDKTNSINTHYLKASRRSAQQVALKPLNDGAFTNLNNASFNSMSVEQFFNLFFFPKEIKEKLYIELGVKSNQTYPKLIESNFISDLPKNDLFKIHYEKNRIEQKEAFIAYLDAFGVNIKENGLALVDVGWGGTMQECIHQFFNKEVPVTGYYIGLKAIYNIEPETKRFGLNFSIYPGLSVSYEILKANGQLYEQLLGAPHGSTLGYTFKNGIPETIEFHEENEKFVFENYVSDTQDYMFIEFEKLFSKLRSINYSDEMVQDYMTKMAMRIGILTNRKRIRFIDNLSKGFYQNIGENKVGLNYNPNQLSVSKLSLLYTFLRNPEKVFHYLVKVKPYLYAKNLYWCSWPINLAYYYMKFNFWIKKKWFSKRLLR